MRLLGMQCGLDWWQYNVQNICLSRKGVTGLKIVVAATLREQVDNNSAIKVLNSTTETRKRGWQKTKGEEVNKSEFGKISDRNAVNLSKFTALSCENGLTHYLKLYFPGFGTNASIVHHNRISLFKFLHTQAKEQQLKLPFC